MTLDIRRTNFYLDTGVHVEGEGGCDCDFSTALITPKGLLNAPQFKAGQSFSFLGQK